MEQESDIFIANGWKRRMWEQLQANFASSHAPYFAKELVVLSELINIDY